MGHRHERRFDRLRQRVLKGPGRAGAAMIRRIGYSRPVGIAALMLER